MSENNCCSRTVAAVICTSLESAFVQSIAQMCNSELDKLKGDVDQITSKLPTKDSVGLIHFELSNGDLHRFEEFVKRAQGSLQMLFMRSFMSTRIRRCCG